MTDGGDIDIVADARRSPALLTLKSETRMRSCFLLLLGSGVGSDQLLGRPVVLCPGLAELVEDLWQGFPEIPLHWEVETMEPLLGR